MDKETYESLQDLKRTLDVTRRLDRIEAKVNRWFLFINIILDFFLGLLLLETLANILQNLVI